MNRRLQTGNTDYWSDPKGEFLSAVAEGPVYKLLGKDGLNTDVRPAAKHPILHDLGYSMHDGGHGMVALDWDIYIEFLRCICIRKARAGGESSRRTEGGRSIMRFIALMAFFCCCSADAQQAVITVPGEPPNLNALKQQLKDYESCTESNCYVPQLERQAELASEFLKRSVTTAKPGERLAVVLDIDETSLSNWAVEIHDDFGFNQTDFNWCVTLRCGKAIGSTLRLFQQAEKDKVAVFFITGRSEDLRTDTEANLKAQGYDQWEALYLRAADHPKEQTVTEYKSGNRAKIVANGYRIVLNVGDQMSDLNGEPQAEHSVKLPNPFYYIP